jgi:hypothetical protein
MDKIEKMATRTVNIAEDLQSVKKLWLDYLVWGNNKMQELYGVHPYQPKETVE